MGKREEMAERHAFDKGIAHTLRKEPAWHYSLIDFKAGWDACLKELEAESKKQFHPAGLHRSITKDFIGRFRKEPR